MNQRKLARVANDNGDDGSGCLIVLSIIVVSVAVSYIFSQAYGWLTFGGIVLLIALRGKAI